ncbi:TfoX/Sxy family protein [Maricaulis sp.]|uniref:TfoX/Sxy family protein n=1 Tax=Maricaulis sp. TaxID=1486257 RepID=UPI003A9023EA
MTFDPDLADRMEAALVARGAMPARRRMFGGIALMVNGHMSYGTSNEEMHVRVGPERYAEALTRPGARIMDMTGKVMTGWVTIDGPSDLDEDELGGWAGLALDFNRTLAPK